MGRGAAIGGASGAPRASVGDKSGNLRIPSPAPIRQCGGMAKYVLIHRHEPEECPIAVAAWKGFTSPLRHGRPLGSCAFGGHTLWWAVEAASAQAALALLPDYVARRTRVEAVREVPIP